MYIYIYTHSYCVYYIPVYILSLQKGTFDQCMELPQEGPFLSAIAVRKWNIAMTISPEMMVFEREIAYTWGIKWDSQLPCLVTGT